MDSIDVGVAGAPLIKLFLIPCPFCGKYPKFGRWHGGGPEKRVVACKHLACHAAPRVSGETPKQAADRWNLRRVGSAVRDAKEIRESKIGSW